MINPLSAVEPHLHQLADAGPDAGDPERDGRNPVVLVQEAELAPKPRHGSGSSTYTTEA